MIYFIYLINKILMHHFTFTNKKYYFIEIDESRDINRNRYRKR